MSNSKLTKIAEELSALTVVEMSELTTMLKKNWNVSDVTFAAAPAAEGGAAAAEKTSFDVFLTSVGESKMSVIKVIKDVTGLGLAESKALADKAPSEIKKGASKAEAEDMKAKLEAAGAKVDLK
jgi:large subunit ribosomal protein L7/L12